MNGIEVEQGDYENYVDLLVEKINFLDYDNDSQKSDNNENSEDDLNKYNYFNYWNISPDIEIDPEFVNSCKENAEEDSFSEKFRVSFN